MSDNRKYYYLKLKENYFDDDSIVLLESMQDGVLYSNILLKLYPNPLCDLSAAFRRSQGFQNRSRAERRQEYGHLHRLPDPARSRLCCHAPLMPVLHSNHGR